jgi:threonine dehydratase
MPSNSAKVKVRAVESYGANIVFCEPTEAAREATCAEAIEKTGAMLIHSFENEHVMAGQGTASVELLEQVSDLDLMMCPVGGGGLLSGTAVATKSMRPKIKVIAVEPANADDAAHRFTPAATGHEKVYDCDGLRTNIGEPTLQSFSASDDIVTVSEEAIVRPCARFGKR